MAKSKRDSSLKRFAPQRIWRWFVDLLKPARRNELALLILIGVVAGLLWTFAAIAEDVVEGEKHKLDTKIILAMRDPLDRSNPIGPEWVQEMARDFTALGGVGVLTFLTLAVAGVLLLERKQLTAWLLLAAIFGGFVLSSVLKRGFARPRPDLVPHGSYVYTSSFPSGHSMMASITYLTLAAMLMRTTSQRRVKIYLVMLAIVLMVCVGISRVYLGAHWPTDVLAGWTLGAAWAILCWLGTRWLQTRHLVEPEPNKN